MRYGNFGLSLLGILFSAVLFLNVAQGQESFNLAYTLTEGGLRLELGPNNNYKGVRLNITSNIATRYEILLRLVNPLENRDRPGNFLGDSFVFRGLRGTNQFGDFRVPVSDSPINRDVVLYVSDATGDADSFTLVFGVSNIQDMEPGYYTGKIAFILNPVGSARQQAIQILDVYVNIPADFSKPKIEISTSNGRSGILLAPDKAQKEDVVLVKITGNYRKPFSIGQVLTGPLISAESGDLSARAINFTVREAKIGIVQNSDTSLQEGQMQSIYSSSAGGQSDKSFLIAYSLNAQSLKAGKYHSRIQYYLDDLTKQSLISGLDLNVESERIFDLKISPQDQRSAIEFYNVKPNEPAKLSEVTLEVLSNIARPYQLTQEVLSDLTNKEGDIVPQNYFTLQSKSEETDGNLRYTQEEAVKKGSSVLYVSDAQGLPAKFRMIYKLSSPSDLKAGDYATRITYTLSEI